MALSIFIETTIPSVYVARPSRNVVQLARQELTRDWWDFYRQQFDLFTSQLVLDEAGDGEPAKAIERLQLMAGIPLLDPNRAVRELARGLISRGILPSVAGRDAFHIATAGVHRMDILLTWNCKHIANPFIADQLHACFSAAGVDLPIICTPEQFFIDDMTPKPKMRTKTDSVLAEVRRTKVKLLERFNYDLDAMVLDAQARQGQSGHPVVDRSTKT